jgi:hypothetical protein
MTDHELFEKMLFALEWNLPVIEDHGEKEQLSLQHKSIIVLRERLAQPEQEPVMFLNNQPLYSNPPQRKSLTYKHIINIAKESRAVEGPHILWVTFARAIEAAHGIKRESFKEKNT